MSTPIVTRGLVGYLAAVLAGGMSVAFLVTALAHADTMLIFLAYFAALPLYLAGLGAGALAGLIAPVAGTLVLLASQPANIAVIYIFAYAVPAVVVSALSLRHRTGLNGKVFWYPEGDILTAITIYPCILFLVAAAVASSHPGGLLDLTQQAFTQVGTQLAKKFPDDRAELFAAAVANAAKIAPALLSYTWILVAIISLGGAQHVLRKQHWNLRESFSLKSIHLPGWVIYAVAITGLLGVMGAEPFDYIGRNLSLILGLPIFFVGLAVVHTVASQVKYPVVFLGAFYVVMTFIPWVALVVAAVGVVDQWFDFRQCIARKTNA